MRAARTASRPIPSGQVTRGGALFVVALSLIGFLVLISFNAFTILLGIGSWGWSRSTLT